MYKNKIKNKARKFFYKSLVTVPRTTEMKDKTLDAINKDESSLFKMTVTLYFERIFTILFSYEGEVCNSV